jgi:hypothetical protein
MNLVTANGLRFSRVHVLVEVRVERYALLRRVPEFILMPHSTHPPSSKTIV